MREWIAALTVLLIAATGAICAPAYLIDARDWDGEQQARFVARIVAEDVGEGAWAGEVGVADGELLDLRARSREGSRTAEGATVEGATFSVEEGAATPDFVVEFEGDAGTRIDVTLHGATVSATVAELRVDDRQRAAGDTRVRMLLTFIYPEEDPEPLRALKPIRSDTPLVVDGEARCVIAVPADSRYDALAGELAAALGAAGEAPLLVHAEDLIDAGLHPNADALGASEVIAVGSTLDNRVLGGLWGRGLALASQLYPGEGGYVIRTAHDPWGLGHNVVVLAGSDADGVERAARAFIDGYVGEGDVVLGGPVVDVEYTWTEHPGVPDRWEKRMPPVRTMEYLREQCMAAGVMDEDGAIVSAEGEPREVVAAVFTALNWLGDTWWYLGGDELVAMMGEIVEKNLDAFEAFEPTPTVEMESGLTGYVGVWDLIEELPVFSDRARLAVTNVLLAQARLGHEPRAMHTLIREGCRQIHDENHGTNSALNDFVVWSYFDRDYDLPEAAYWLEMVDALFRGQASSFQVAEDAAGYNHSCPNHTMSYAFARPNLEYLERGVARHLSDYFLTAGINNLGLMSGFGDTGGLVPVGYFTTFANALWYYRDGRYRWPLEHLMHKNSGLRAYSSRLALRDDVPAEEPVDLTGIRPEWIYERQVEKGGGVLDPVYLPEEPTGDGAFNKVALREAWGPDRQYLLISGMKRDGHSQNDVNAVVNLTDNGKMWLVDHEYGLRRGADHSGIVAMQDGAFREPASQAVVEEIADFPASGALGTTVRLGDLSWKRNILWLKGGWYAVIDDLTATESAEYVLRASWRGLGEEQLRADRMILTQGDERYAVITDGDGSLDIQRVPFARDSAWRAFYGDVDPVAKVFRDDRAVDLQAGEVARYAALLAPGAAEADIVRLDGPAVAVTAGAETWIAATGPFALDGVEFVGQQAIIGTGAITVVAATSLTVSDEVLLAGEQPVSITVDLASGEAQLADGSEPAAITWRGADVRLTADVATALDVAGLSEALGDRAGPTLMAAFEAKRARLAQDAPEPSYEGVEALASVQLDSPVVALAPADAGAVVGLEDGAVVVLDADNEPLWRWEAEAPIAAVTGVDLDGDGADEVVAGSEDGQVTALRGGDVLWQFAMRPSDRASYTHAKMFATGDLDQDGSVEILAVGPFLHCLNADGSEAWQDYYSYWRDMWRTDGECVSVSDLTGDGKLEVIISYVDGYSGTRTLDADGEALMPERDQFASPHIDHGVPAANLGADIDGDDVGDVAVGYDGGVLTFEYDATEYSGHLNMGSVLHLAAGVSAEHDPLIFATNDMGDLRGLYHRDADAGLRLRVAWRVNMGESITALAVTDLTGDGTTEAVVGTRGGNLRVVSAAGATLAAVDGHPAGVVGLVITGDAGGREIVVGRADGSVERMRLLQ
ncbi:MAG: hypothetical protein R6V07_03055 [Armatimonadota bacterium]